MPQNKRAGRCGGLFPHIPHFVYLAGDDEGIKIGFTRSPRTRLKELCRETGRDLHFLHITKGYCELENRLHRRYAHKRIKGEWFALSEDDVEAVRAEFPACDPRSVMGEHIRSLFRRAHQGMKNVEPALEGRVPKQSGDTRKLLEGESEEST